MRFISGVRHNLNLTADGGAIRRAAKGLQGAATYCSDAVATTFIDFPES